MVFRKTNQHIGRHVSVTPSNSTNQHLCYGRILLNPSQKSVAFNNDGEETGLVCLSGEATVVAGDQQFEIARYDSVYIARASEIEVTTKSSVDFAEFSADVENVYPIQVVRYADLSKEPSLKFTTGKPGQQRHLNICLGKNVQAGRLLVGFTFSEPGNWTSWPPHEHGQMLEEMYVYFNMPAPAFGLQLVYNNTDYPELVVPVRDGDAVLMPSGYHPNVSVPVHPSGSSGQWQHIGNKWAVNSAWSRFSPGSIRAGQDSRPAGTNSCLSRRSRSREHRICPCPGQESATRRQPTRISLYMVYLIDAT